MFAREDDKLVTFHNGIVAECGPPRTLLAPGVRCVCVTPSLREKLLEGEAEESGTMFGHAWAMYVKLLADYPLKTNMGTAFVVGVLGDCMAQTIEIKSEHWKSGSDRNISPERALKVGTFFILSAYPLFHWYRALDRKFPTTLGSVPARQAIRLVVPKVALNQCFAAPVNNSFFYTFVVFVDSFFFAQRLDGDNFVDAVKRKLVKEMPTTTRNSMCVWGRKFILTLIVTNDPCNTF